jgi:PAS domain S-box-containing protein
MQMPLDDDLKKLLMLSRDLFAIANGEGFLVWVSPGWEALLGWSEGELLARPYLDFVHPNDIDGTLREAQSIVEGHATVAFCNRYVCKDGSYRWLEWNASPLVDGRIYCTVRDATERKAVLHSLRDQARHLKLVEEVAQMGHWRYDFEKSTVHWSEGLYKILQEDPATFQPTLETELHQQSRGRYVEGDFKRLEAAIEQALQAKADFSVELRVPQRGGEPRTLATKGMCELGEDGEIIGLFAVLRDVTEIKAMQRQMVQSERLTSLGTLAAGLAHEVNNPLAYVLANLAWIISELERAPNETHKELIEAARDAQDGAERVKKIVEGLTRFARVGKEQRERLDIHQTLESAVRMSAHAIREKATLRKRFKALGVVKGDETQMTQVFLNLLLNAVQAIPPDAPERHWIELRTENRGLSHVVVEVQDSGCGMNSATIERIFEPFFTTKALGIGTGLGLSICHGIVSAHGGQIEVHSAQGEGTTFRVVLPVASDIQTLP